jgi:hypothetical protein
VERSEVSELVQRLDESGIGSRGRAEALTAVHYPVADGIGLAKASVERLLDLIGVRLRARRVQLSVCDRGVVFVEQAELEAARPGVDRQHPHADIMKGNDSWRSARPDMAICPHGSAGPGARRLGHDLG